MKKIKNKLKKVILRFFLSIRNIYKIFKTGGFTSVNITTVNTGNLLVGKRVLITGGSTGIGYSIAHRCLEEGADVLITGRSLDKLEKAKEQLNSDKLSVVSWDVSDLSILDEKLKESKQLLGGDIDILVNNAGIVNGVRFPNVTEEVWDKVYSINSKGLFFLTQSLCSIWESRKDKSIKKVINISSQGGFVGATYPYRMTKWDINGLTKGLGLNLAPKGIIVNGIAPGITTTPAVETYFKEKDNIYCSQNPMERVALPEEIAELAIFLIGEASNFIVGQTIVCDGGYSLK